MENWDGIRYFSLQGGGWFLQRGNPEEQMTRNTWAERLEETKTTKMKVTRKRGQKEGRRKKED